MASAAPIDSSEGSDPFDLAYEYQLAVIRHVRQGVEDLAAVRERIELQLQELQEQASAPEEDSEAAARDETPRHDLLSQRAAVRERIADLKTQIELVARQEEILRTTSRRLQEHVERFRTEKEFLKASYAATNALLSAIGAMSATSTGS